MVCRISNPGPNQPRHLLESFIAQECVSVSLTRRLVYFRDARQGASVIARDPTAVTSGKYCSLEDVCDESKEVGNPAVWWSPKGAGSADCAHGPDVVLLEGEMHLEPDLLPSCEIPFLLVSVCISDFTTVCQRTDYGACQYTVSVSLSQSQELSIAATPAGSTPSSPTTPTCRRTSRFSRSAGSDAQASKSSTEPGASVECTASHPVTIVTVKASGPHPIGYMPRPVVKKPDLSTVQQVEYAGPSLIHWG